MACGPGVIIPSPVKRPLRHPELCRVQDHFFELFGLLFAELSCFLARENSRGLFKCNRDVLCHANSYPFYPCKRALNRLSAVKVDSGNAYNKPQVLVLFRVVRAEAFLEAVALALPLVGRFPVLLELL